uniref:Uncharacterized protein n=1 Tax=Stomoxys calcitrans TaxID=35570 RepID=A0A1I8PEM3_STOCA
MVKLILYMHPASAPSRAVIFVAKYIGVGLEYKIVDFLKRDTLKPDFLKMNPLHTLPTLIDGSAVIYDSHAICSYLVEKYAPNDDKLYPKDLIKRAFVDAILHFDSCDLFSPMRSMYAPIFYHGFHELRKETIATIQHTWLTMERLLENHHFMCGDDMTIADICCIATTTAVLAFAPIDEKACPKLLAWVKRMRAMPFYSEDGAEGVKKIVLEKIMENCKV